MGQKDISEKILESYNDVFADIVNVLVFNGKQVVKEKDLEEADPKSAYKADGKLREIERDVAKRWKKGNIRIACLGFENQTAPDKSMPLRVISYDASEYRQQCRNSEVKSYYPVVTLVLYFGYNKHWDKPINLKECLNIPEGLDSWVNDYKINLVEIAYLSREQVNMFKSDFKIVADFFVQMRENGIYRGSPEKVKYVQEIFDVFHAVTDDDRFDFQLVGEEFSKLEVKSMCDWLDKLVDEGKAEGINSSRQQTAKRLYSMGVDNKFIARALDVSEQDVQEILKTVVM